jgi:hypothetical protein
MNSKTGIAFSIVGIVAVMAFFASDQLVANQQAQAQMFGRFGGFHGGFGFFHHPFFFHHVYGFYHPWWHHYWWHPWWHFHW